MNWRQLWTASKRLVARGLPQIETKLKEWIKPAVGAKNPIRRRFFAHATLR